MFYNKNVFRLNVSCGFANGANDIEVKRLQGSISKAIEWLRLTSTLYHNAIPSLEVVFDLEQASFHLNAHSQFSIWSRLLVEIFKYGYQRPRVKVIVAIMLEYWIRSQLEQRKAMVAAWGLGHNAQVELVEW